MVIGQRVETVLRTVKLGNQIMKCGRVVLSINQVPTRRKGEKLGGLEETLVPLQCVGIRA